MKKKELGFFFSTIKNSFCLLLIDFYCVFYVQPGLFTFFFIKRIIG